MIIRHLKDPVDILLGSRDRVMTRLELRMGQSRHTAYDLRVERTVLEEWKKRDDGFLGEEVALH